MGAEILKTPELELDKDECTKLADAIKEVSQYYVTAFDPKKIAWCHLAVIAGGIYGTRIFAHRNRMQLKKQLSPTAQKPQAKPTPINTGGQQAQKVNGAATPSGKVEIDPTELWGMTSGEL